MELSENLQDQIKAAAILGAFIWVFDSIDELKHNQDIQGKDVSSHSAQFVNTWDNYDVDQQEEKDDLNENWTWREKMSDRLRLVELSVKDAEIAALKRELEQYCDAE